MSGAGGYREVCKKRILGFAGAVRHETVVAVGAREFDGVERFADGADLV